MRFDVVFCQWCCTDVSPQMDYRVIGSEAFGLKTVKLAWEGNNVARNQRFCSVTVLKEG